MPRFFTPSKNISGDKITLSDKDQLHHICRVLRLKIKDEVMVFDEKTNEYKTEIERITSESIILGIKARKRNAINKNVRITVACAIPKKSKMDEIIDKLTQLGVDRVIPLETERVIVILDEKKKKMRLARWQKIAQSASLQSQRNSLPTIEPIKDINAVLSEAKDSDLKLIPTLFGKRSSLKEVLDKSKSKNILIFIGPEGDFTQKELTLAKKAGCIPVSLGELVLRVDTAAIAAVSFIRLYENS
jgi:16S rRNA (uracil1498-N3)-methyltransferase